MKIGVLTDTENRVAAFETGGIVRVYEKTGCDWGLVNSYDYNTEDLSDGFKLRERLSELCLWLGDCKILAARRFRGTYRGTFERYNISMYEMAEYEYSAMSALLNFIAGYDTKLCAEEKETEPELQPLPAPIEKVPGNYYIDLIDVMKHKTKYNSKEILLPFLKKTSFSSLEIICEHMPKWFDSDIDKSKYKIKISENEGRMSVVLQAY